MAAVGNLNDYVKFQMAQGMEKGGSAGGLATEMAVGPGDRAADDASSRRAHRRATAPAAAILPRLGAAGRPLPPPAPALDLLSPADVAKRARRRRKSDVMAILESGELAGEEDRIVLAHQASALDAYLAK